MAMTLEYRTPRANTVMRGVTSGLFALIGPSLFLPALTIVAIMPGCESPTTYQQYGRVDRTFTGWDLATSQTKGLRQPRSGDPAHPADRRHLADVVEGSQPWFIGVLVVALLGALLTWPWVVWGPIIAIALGLGGAFLLFVGAAPLTESTVYELEPGFFLAVGLFIAAALSGLLRLLMPRLRQVDKGQLAPPGIALAEARPPPEQSQ